jgi:hypothetical protein
MPATQLDRPAATGDAFALEHFDGAAFRLALAPAQAAIRAPEKKNSDSRVTPVSLDHQQELVKLLNGLSYRHSHWQVFSDFCEMAAIALSNAVDFAPREKREARYMQIVKGYNREELDTLSRGLAHLTMALEDDFGDVLGRTFHDLELHNKWAGQFFTPNDVCRMMASMTIGDSEDLKARIAARGFVTAQEPAVGSGAMVIALARAIRDAGINYQKHLHVTAIDIDAKCVHMAYAQFSLLHIPAIIIHGDTLRLEEYSHWYTPAHIMGGWRWKLRRQAAIDEAHTIITLPLESEAAPVETPPEQKPDAPRGQLKLF